jgi:hypothetical protein
MQVSELPCRLPTSSCLLQSHLHGQGAEVRLLIPRGLCAAFLMSDALSVSRKAWTKHATMGITHATHAPRVSFSKELNDCDRLYRVRTKMLSVKSFCAIKHPASHHGGWRFPGWYAAVCVGSVVARTAHVAAAAWLRDSGSGEPRPRPTCYLWIGRFDRKGGYPHYYYGAAVSTLRAWHTAECTFYWLGRRCTAEELQASEVGVPCRSPTNSVHASCSSRPGWTLKPNGCPNTAGRSSSECTQSRRRLTPASGV